MTFHTANDLKPFHRRQREIAKMNEFAIEDDWLGIPAAWHEET
jgi:hypothetical protein